MEPIKDQPHWFLVLKDKLTLYFEKFQLYADRPWYHPFLFFLTGIDHFLGVVPVDTLLISCVLLKPRTWIFLAAEFVIGSTLGAMALAALTLKFGQPFVDTYFSTWTQGDVWLQISGVIAKHGTLGMFAISLMPAPLAPAIILCGLAKLSLSSITLAILIGRTIKYLLIAWISAHAPKFVSKNPHWNLKK